MHLVACKSCRAQYDTTELDAAEFTCRCGATVRNEILTGVDAKILRCGGCGAAVTEDAEQCDYCASPIVRDRRDLSLICPECFARNADDTRFCTACGVAFRPQRASVEGYELPCPACGVSMPPHHVGGVGVNECPACRGLWVPRENFDVLINRAIDVHRNRAAAGYLPPQTRVAGGNPATNKVEYRRCPECEQMMARRNFRRSSGVVVDRCPEHGTWLDADELEQIAGYILRGGARLPAAAPGRAPASPGGADGSRAQDSTTGGTPKMSQRTREILAERRAQRERNRGAEVARTVLGFLGELLTTEVSRWD